MIVTAALGAPTPHILLAPLPPLRVLKNTILCLLPSDYYTSSFKNFCRRKPKVPDIFYLSSLNSCVRLVIVAKVTEAILM